MKRLSILLSSSDIETLTAARRRPRCPADTQRYIQILFALSGPEAGERSVARALQVSRDLVRKVARLHTVGGVAAVLAHKPVASRPPLPAERIDALKDLAAKHPDWRVVDLANAVSATVGHISKGSAVAALKGRPRRRASIKPA
jgi:hypothetical protein